MHFLSLFPSHLRVLNLFCFKNDVIITLKWTDSATTLKPLYKGKAAYSCTIYNFSFCQKKTLYLPLLCVCMNETMSSITVIVWFTIVQMSYACITHNIINKWSLLCQSQQNSKRLSALWTMSLLLLYLSALCNALLQNQNSK